MVLPKHTDKQETEQKHPKTPNASTRKQTKAKSRTAKHQTLDATANISNAEPPDAAPPQGPSSTAQPEQRAATLRAPLLLLLLLFLREFPRNICLPPLVVRQAFDRVAGVVEFSQSYSTSCLESVKMMALTSSRTRCRLLPCRSLLPVGLC